MTDIAIPSVPPPRVAPATPLLSVEGLRVEYGTANGFVPAVRGVSFHVAHGEIFGLAGESGSGKSTLAHAVLRLLPPPAIITGGKVVFDGEDMLGKSDDELRRVWWRKASIVFQSALNALNPVLTVGEQIADVLRVHDGMSARDAMDRASTLLAAVGIRPERRRSYPHELSGGMRQRVVIAIALALSPKLLVLDEPTTALDVVVQRDILAQITDLQRRLGFSVLFITHDLSLMLEISTRIGILYAGELVEVGAAEQILQDPKHPYTQGLLASFPSITGPRRRLTGVPGIPPRLEALPSGCPFHPRCARALPRCEAEAPRSRVLGDAVFPSGAPEHRAACHLY